MAVKANKRTLWLKYFLDESSATFLNKTESARAAKYKAKNDQILATIGCENFRKLEGHISEWLDSNGLSENALKLKLCSLLDAKETKFFQFEGEVSDEREVEALGVQQRALDMALKVKGMYAPEKKNVSVHMTVTEMLDEIEEENDPICKTED